MSRSSLFCHKLISMEIGRARRGSLRGITWEHGISPAHALFRELVLLEYLLTARTQYLRTMRLRLDTLSSISSSPSPRFTINKSEQTANAFSQIILINGWMMTWDTSCGTSSRFSPFLNMKYSPPTVVKMEGEALWVGEGTESGCGDFMTLIQWGWWNEWMV